MKILVRRKYVNLWIIILVITITALLLLIHTLENNIVFFYGPTELTHMKEKPQKTFRLGGLVTNNSYRFELNEQGKKHTFSLEDNINSINVSFNGVLPDLFREGQSIIALGRWQDEHFIAYELLAKHDEKYMPKEVRDILE